MKALIAIIWCISLCHAEVFTAMSDINHLLTTESEMIRTFENYITAQEQRLEKLKGDLIEMSKVHDEALKSEDFFANPLNSYLLVKRLSVDWSDIQNILSEDSVGQSCMAEIIKLPDEEDLSGIAQGLMRLQDTYKLNTAELASGSILGRKTAYRELNAADCFELGRQAYNTGDYYHTMLWMNEALIRQENEINKTVEKADVLEYLAYSTYMQGNVRQALKLTYSLLEERPNHQKALGNVQYYEEFLRNQEEKGKKSTGDVSEEEISAAKGYTVSENTASMTGWQKEREAYERLCRGESRMSPATLSKLTCHYKTGPSPFLRYTPVKAEIAHINPTIIIYHDVISDREIEVVKNLALPKFRRATVQNYLTGELEPATYRISKSAWLKTDDAPEVEVLDKRLADLTDLVMETAEDLQVANYGIGGHYEPHFDYARMTDVDAGGATVFPYLELSLWPKKGSAAFWHNLFANGEGDEDTRHAACPVLIGQKWVANRWIHERGQEFKRPCGLKFEDI